MFYTKSGLVKILQDIYVVPNSNALFAKRIGALVVGDMHIGMERKYESTGIHFERAAETNANNILSACKESGAKSIIFLGDVKDSIGFPDKEEKEGIARFFYLLKKYHIYIAKGNHDGHLIELFERLGINADIENEILMKDFAFMHGHTMPTTDALSKKYIVAAHGHFVIRIGSTSEKIFMLAKRKRALDGAKNSRLILVPAFSNLIYGTNITMGTKKMIPMFRNRIFDFDSAQVFGNDGRELGKAKDFAELD